jgi:hypothetical protein
MKTLKNSHGFSVVHSLLVFVVVGIVGFTGWYVINANKQASSGLNTVSSASSSSTKAMNQSTDKKRDPKSQSEYYQITLPSGWKLTNEKPKGVAYDDAYVYTDAAGKKLTVYVNIGNVGGAGDASIDYKVSSDRITVSIDNVTLTSCSSEDDPCEVGDGRLKIVSSSASKIKSNNYLFIFEDEKSESTGSLSTFKALVESMQF